MIGNTYKNSWWPALKRSKFVDPSLYCEITRKIRAKMHQISFCSTLMTCVQLLYRTSSITILSQAKYIKIPHMMMPNRNKISSKSRVARILTSPNIYYLNNKAILLCALNWLQIEMHLNTAIIFMFHVICVQYHIVHSTQCCWRRKRNRHNELESVYIFEYIVQFGEFAPLAIMP